MKLIRQSEKGVSENRIPKRPSWLTKWINNQGQFVLLACNCVEDLNCRGLTSITGPKPIVYCETHGFVSVRKSLSAREAIQLRSGIKFEKDNDPEGLFPPF